MNVGLRRTLIGALALWPAALGMTSCADNESTIFIRQVNVPVSSGTGCTVEASPTNPFITRGLLDLAFRSQYVATLLVGNQLVPRGSATQARTETARVAIQGTEVHAVDNATGTVVFGPKTVPGSGFVDPATGSNASYGLTDSVLFGVDPGSQASLDFAGSIQAGTGSRSVTAFTKVFGRTLGGMDVESGEWEFPISICYGCLVAYPPDASNPALGRPNCDAPVATGTTLDTPCAIGQDSTVDCRLCKQVRGADPICEPP
jgi:hypothetical protein